MQHAIMNKLLQKIKTPYYILELYVVTEQNLNLNNEKQMIACFSSYEKSKLFDYKKSIDIEYNFKYEIKMVRLTKDKSEKLLLYDDISPSYKTITISNILKYLTI